MDTFEKMYNKALRFLSYRPRSEKEVRERLRKAKTSEEIIEKIIIKLKEYNFLNDLEFAKSWVENRKKLNPKALRLIKLELKQKGVSSNIIEALKLKTEADLGLARLITDRKVQKMKNLPKEEIQKKLYGFLARRGFNYDIIKQSVDEILKKGV